jgi:hypothetical protein
MITRPKPQELPHDVYSDSSSLAADATGASGTRPPCAGQSAARRGPTATAAGESRARSAGGEAAPDLEGRQGLGFLD